MMAPTKTRWNIPAQVPSLGKKNAMSAAVASAAERRQYGCHPVLPYDRARFVREVDELEEVGLFEDALYVTTDGGPAPLLADWDFRQIGSVGVDLPRLAAVEKRLPTRKESLSLDYRIYRMVEER